jgi:DNA-binding MarR family transcriptional regulator
VNEQPFTGIEPGAEEELERLGRFYGEQRFAIAWTASNNGDDDAKRVTTKDWQHTKPLEDADFAAGLFKERGKTRNPAIVLRPSGLVAIECDGAEDLARVEELDLPPTLTARSSAPDRRHLYFRPPAPLETLPFVAFRFEAGELTADAGRYFVAPPALHPSGAVYSFLPELGPGEVAIAEMPAALYLDLCKRARQAADKAAPAELGERIPQGRRRNAMLRVAGKLKRAGLTTDEILPALRELNKRCDPPLDEEELRSVAGRSTIIPAERLGRDAPPGAGPSLASVEAAFRRYLHLPDATPLHVVLATLVANRMEEGEPVWLVILGGSSRGKTELLIALAGLEGVRVIGALTPAALLSGTPPKDRQEGATGGILRELGSEGVLVVKDFGAILSLPHETRSQVLQGMRDIYDGRYTRDIGAGGGRKLEWEGRLGLIAGATSALDYAHAVLSALGERWLTLRIVAGSERDQSRLARASADTGRMRAELQDVVTDYVSHVGIPELHAVADEVGNLLDSLAILACFARSPVERDRYTRELLLVHQPEGPARMVRQLHKLYVCLEALGADALPVVGRLAFDSIPSPRREVLLHMLEGEDASTLTADVATALDLPTRSAERALEELTAHGLLRRSKSAESATSANVWRVTELGAELWADVRQTRMDSRMELHPQSHPPPISINPEPTNDDFAGEADDGGLAWR